MITDGATPFADPRVLELWKMVKQGNFSEGEKRSLEEELRHYERRIDKHRHFRFDIRLHRYFALLSIVKHFSYLVLNESSVKSKVLTLHFNQKCVLMISYCIYICHLPCNCFF